MKKIWNSSHDLVCVRGPVAEWSQTLEVTTQGKVDQTPVLLHNAKKGIQF